MLGSYHGLGVGQSGEGLVALFIQQQTFEVTAEPLALGALRKEIVEVSGVILEQTGGGLYVYSLRGRANRRVAYVPSGSQKAIQSL
jgi:hypothetical protein